MSIKQWTFIVLILAMVLLVTSVNAQDNSEGYVGITANLTPTDTVLGLSGDYHRTVLDWSFDVEGQFQKTSGITGITILSFQRNFDAVEFKPYTEIVFSAEGRQQDYGFVANFPLSGLDVAIGGSFRNADPVSEPGFDSEGFTTRVGYNPETGKFKDANTFSLNNTKSINLIVMTSVDALNTGIKASIPVRQLSDEKAYPQIITRSSKSFDVGGIDFMLSADLRFQITENAVEFDKAITASAGIKF